MPHPGKATSAAGLRLRPKIDISPAPLRDRNLNITGQRRERERGCGSGRVAALGLDTLLWSMNQMANFAQCSGCPFISPLIVLGIEIVKNIQQMRDNLGAFAQLASDTHGLLQTIADVVKDRQRISAALQRRVGEFTRVLKNVLGFVKETQSSGMFHRFFLAAEDTRKIDGWRNEIRTAKESFELAMQMGMHENIVQILTERRISNSNGRLPAYGESTDPEVPDEINQIAEKEFVRLVDILGVVHVQQEDELPTALRIARVLNLDKEDVEDVWDPIAQHLGTIADTEKRGRVLKYLERVVCFKAGVPPIDEEKYHGVVARWCLGDLKCAADVFYSSDHRVHHICHSTPSLELCQALSSSDEPFDPEDELREITTWILKKVENPGKEWLALMTRYGMQDSDMLPTPAGWTPDGWTHVDNFGFER